jgi:hypothetical protein
MAWVLSKFGPDDYRVGAMARLDEALLLVDQERWTGACYLAGRAVESMRRCLLCIKVGKADKGHELRDLAKRAGFSELLTSDDDQLNSRLNEVAVIWHNNLRYVGDKKLKRHLLNIAGFKNVKGDLAKSAAKNMCDSAEAIVARGDLRWKNFKKSSTKS